VFPADWLPLKFAFFDGRPQQVIITAAIDQPAQSRGGFCNQKSIMGVVLQGLTPWFAHMEF
jgi:hypothetical protein